MVCYAEEVLLAPLPEVQPVDAPEGLRSAALLHHRDLRHIYIYIYICFVVLLYVFVYVCMYVCIIISYYKIRYTI